MLKCLCSDLTEDQFVSEERVGCSSAVGPQGAAVRSGRAALWRILRGTPLTVGGCLFKPVSHVDTFLTLYQHSAPVWTLIIIIRIIIINNYYYYNTAGDKMLSSAV